jgi:hypothetical protein
MGTHPGIYHRDRDQQLLLRNEYPVAENRILKAQLQGRLRLSDAERARLGEIGHRLGRMALSEVATGALLSRSPHQFWRNRRAAERDQPPGRQASLCDGWRVEHPNEHGRNAEHDGSALSLEQAQHKFGIVARRQNLGTTRLQSAERAKPAAGGVKHRHRIDPDVLRPPSDRPRIDAPVIREVAMGQARSFGSTGRSGRVLYLRDIVGLDRRQCGSRLAAPSGTPAIGQGDDLAEIGKRVTGSIDCLHKIPVPVDILNDNAARPRLS